MPRVPRVDVGGEVYHVINRANARLPLFFKEKDYQLLQDILFTGAEKYNMRILAFCIMPNHFHLILHPRADGDLQLFMQWITLTHTQRWHVQNKTTGSGHLYQGRYKAFLIESDEHLFTVIRYVERNPLRALLVKDLLNWKFGSYYLREHSKQEQQLLAPWPIDIPTDYTEMLHQPLTAGELESLRYSVNRGKPYGSDTWQFGVIDKYKLQGTIRGRGRPKKGT